VKHVATADNLMIATLWQRVLEAAGISCQIRNRFLASAAGELPPDHVLPQIWVVNARDLHQAQTLLAEIRRPSDLPAWRCVSCAEIVEGQFFQCWRCEARRP